MTFAPEAIFDLLIMVLVGVGITVVVFAVIYLIALRVVREPRDVEALADTQPDALRAMRRESPPDPDEWEVALPSRDVDCSDGNGAGTA